MLSATPETSSRRRSHHRERGDARSSQVRPPTLPEYQPPTAPLNDAGQRALTNLLQSHHLRHLRTHLQHASEKLTDSAGEVNERLTDAKVRYQKRKRQRLGSNEEGDENANDENRDGDGDNDEEARKLARTEEQVNAVTEKLEASMRAVLDAEVKVEGLTVAITELGREAQAQAAERTQRERQRQRASRRGRRQDMEETDEDEGGEDENDDEYEATPEREAREAHHANPPSRKLEERLAGDVERWQGLSLTQRYSTHNAYIGFYRIIHDAKHPGDDIPPLPHSSTWFAHLEDPSAASAATSASQRTRRNKRAASPADSDDIAIESERISLKCPLTLLMYVDPVTSTKCPHSFERQAILDMIAQSQTTLPAPPGSRHRRIRYVKCPVCSTNLTADDLQRDPVLLRRVRRAQAAEQREADDDSDAEESRRRRTKGGRQSGFTVASGDEGAGGYDDDDDDDDGEEVDDESDIEEDSHRPVRVRHGRHSEQVRIKSERAMSRGSSTAPTATDYDDEDEE